MRHGRSFDLLPAVLLLAAACDAGDPPTGPAPTAPLTLCASAQWMAYRNEGGEWTRLVPGGDGFATINATERIAIASASGMNMPNVTPHLSVEFLTAEQARESLAYPCRPSVLPPSGSVTGVVRGIEGDGWATVYHGSRYAGGMIPASQPEFTLSAWAGEHDLVATRFPPRSLMPDHADRVIIRRAQRLDAGASVTLDFTSSEAFALVPHTLSWNGPPTGAQLNFQTTDVVGNGNDVFLHQASNGAPPGPDGPQALTLYGVPAARLAAGDLHRLSTGDGRRSIELFYHEARDRTIAWGPAASRPRLVTVGTSPSVRLRIEVPSQREYGSSITVILSQYAVINGFRGATNRVFMTATREYFGGTPRTWMLEMPNLTGVPGFQDVFGLHPGAYEWSVRVTDSPFWFEYAEATDGTTIRSAADWGEATAP